MKRAHGCKKLVSINNVLCIPSRSSEPKAESLFFLCSIGLTCLPRRFAAPAAPTFLFRRGHNKNKRPPASHSFCEYKSERQETVMPHRLSSPICWTHL